MHPAAPELDWPPVVGRSYPDLELADQEGRSTRLSSFRGKVLLVELVGLDCPACNAFSGAGTRGGFRGVKPQRGLESIGSYIRRFAKVSLDDPRVVFVQLLIYNMGRAGPPTAEDTAEWARHYGLRRSEGEVVLRGDQRLIGQESFNMIPGFHLVDPGGRFVSDSSGHRPRHDLYTHLLPTLGRLVKSLPAR